MYFCGYVVEICKGNIVHDCLAELYVYTMCLCVRACVCGVVGVSTRLRVGRSGLRVPVKTEEYSVPCNAQTGSGAHTATHFNECCVLFLGVKPLLRGVKQSFLCSVGVKNVWVCTSAPRVFPSWRGLG